MLSQRHRRPLLRCFLLLLFCIFAGVSRIALGESRWSKPIANLAARGGRQRFSSKKKLTSTTTGSSSSSPEIVQFKSGRSDRDTALSLSHKGKSQYSWQAGVNRVTGMASSLETSNVPVDCRLAQSVSSCCNDDGKNGPMDGVMELADTLFREYPLWLSRFRVTFGVLQTVADQQGHEVRTRPFGIPILRFGVPARRHSCVMWWPSRRKRPSVG